MLKSSFPLRLYNRRVPKHECCKKCSMGNCIQWVDTRSGIKSLGLICWHTPSQRNKNTFCHTNARAHTHTRSHWMLLWVVKNNIGKMFVLKFSVQYLGGGKFSQFHILFIYTHANLKSSLPLPWLMQVSVSSGNQYCCSFNSCIMQHRKLCWHYLLTRG